MLQEEIKQKIRQGLILERDRLPKEDQTNFLLTELIVEIRTQRAASEARIEQSISLQKEVEGRLMEILPMVGKMIPAGRSGNG